MLLIVGWWTQGGCVIHGLGSTLKAKGLQREREFIRMVIDFDIKAEESGNLPQIREDIEKKYREWFTLSESILRK